MVVRYEVTALKRSVASGVGNPLAISPDGRYLATVLTNAQGLRALWLKSVSELSSREIEGSGGASDPFFSTDGKWICFFMNGRLWKVSVGGGGAVVLAEARPGRTSWSSKGFLVQADGVLLSPGSGNAGQRGRTDGRRIGRGGRGARGTPPHSPPRIALGPGCLLPG